MSDTRPLDPDGKARLKAAQAANMQKAQETLQEMRAAGWKPVRLNPVDQYHRNPTSLRAAIKAHCWVCVGADADPGAKFRVRDCAVGPKCALFNHRPWQNIKGGVHLSEDGDLAATDASEDTSED